MPPLSLDYFEQYALRVHISQKRKRSLSSFVGLRVIRRKNRKRREWVRNWIKGRNNWLETLRTHHLEFSSEDSDSYKNYCPMTEDTFEELLTKIEHRMRGAMTARQRLSVTLRFLATGCKFESTQYDTKMPENIMSTVIATMKAIISELQDECIKCPSTPKDWIRVEEQFRVLWNFPHCVGALEGKHINYSPPKKARCNKNKTGKDSIVLLALADARCRFLSVDMIRNVRTNDANVYTESNIGRKLQEGSLNFPEPQPLHYIYKCVPYVVAAAGSFHLTKNVMKPFRSRELPHRKRVFNYRLSQAMRAVENAFGILVKRFRILQRTISLDADKVEMITLVCCILHNFILSREPVPLMTGVLNEPSQVELNCTLSKIGRQNRKAPTADVDKDIRQSFMYYFCTAGLLSWQHQIVNKPTT